MTDDRAIVKILFGDDVQLTIWLAQLHQISFTGWPADSAGKWPIGQDVDKIWRTKVWNEISQRDLRVEDGTWKDAKGVLHVTPGVCRHNLYYLGKGNKGKVSD